MVELGNAKQVFFCQASLLLEVPATLAECVCVRVGVIHKDAACPGANAEYTACHSGY